MHLFHIVQGTNSEYEIVAERHQHEVIGDGDSAPTLIVSEHGEDCGARFRDEVVEGLVVDVAEHEILWRSRHWVVRVLRHVGWHWGHTLGAIAAKDYGLP